MAKGKASGGGSPRPNRPVVWMMTDPRFGDALIRSARALPFGSVIVLRHYDLEESARRALFRQLRRIAKRRGMLVFLADTPRNARRWRADGVHGRWQRGRCAGLDASTAVHDRQELRAASRAGAQWMLISPVHATRSHPGQPVLGVGGWRALAQQANRQEKVIALGGMNRARAAMMRNLPVDGWAAIDALIKR